MTEQLPDVVMIAALEAQIREVIQVNFLLPDLNAHRHCDMLELINYSLSDILEVVIAKDKVDSAVQTVENLIPLFSTSEAEVTEMEYDIIRTDQIVPVSDDGFVHLTYSFERTIAILQYVGVIEMGVGSEEQPVTVKLEVHCHLFLLRHPGGNRSVHHGRCNQADCKCTGYCRWFCLYFDANDRKSNTRYGCW